MAGVPRYRCVGGPLDGQWRSIHGMRLTIVVADKSTPFWPSAPDCDVIKGRVDYTIRAVRSGDAPNILFLAPEDWTDARALAHVLTAWDCAEGGRDGNSR